MSNPLPFMGAQPGFLQGGTVVQSSMQSNGVNSAPQKKPAPAAAKVAPNNGQGMPKPAGQAMNRSGSYQSMADMASSGTEQLYLPSGAPFTGGNQNMNSAVAPPLLVQQQQHVKSREGKDVAQGGSSAKGSLHAQNARGVPSGASKAGVPASGGNTAATPDRAGPGGRESTPDSIAPSSDSKQALGTPQTPQTPLNTTGGTQSRPGSAASVSRPGVRQPSKPPTTPNPNPGADQGSVGKHAGAGSKGPNGQQLTPLGMMKSGQGGSHSTPNLQGSLQSSLLQQAQQNAALEGVHSSPRVEGGGVPPHVTQQNSFTPASAAQGKPRPASMNIAQQSGQQQLQQSNSRPNSQHTSPFASPFNQSPVDDYSSQQQQQQQQQQHLPTPQQGHQPKPLPQPLKPMQGQPQQRQMQQVQQQKLQQQQKPQQQQQKPACVEVPGQDEVGHYQVVPGKMIDTTPPFNKGRYKSIKLLGSGTYGKVVLCEDNKYNQALVAVKLVRNTPHLYRLAAMNEIKILRELDGRNCTVKILRDFEFQGHVSMTFELLGDNLSSVLQKVGGPLPMDHVRDVGLQLLQALAYTHSKKIIHSDVKSDNVLLVGESIVGGSMIIKLVDFGSALYQSAWHPPLVGTMHYRAPEAVLQAGWSYGVDIWAVGCIIVELATGKQLFELAHDDVHLAMMEKVLGPLPALLMRKGLANLNQYNRALLVKDARGAVHLAPCRADGHEKVAKMMRLKDYIHDPCLLDLVRRLMEYDPSKRITAKDALMHSFFNPPSKQASRNVTPDTVPLPAQEMPSIGASLPGHEQHGNNTLLTGGGNVGASVTGSSASRCVYLE